LDDPSDYQLRWLWSSDGHSKAVPSEVFVQDRPARAETAVGELVNPIEVEFRFRVGRAAICDLETRPEVRADLETEQRECVFNSRSLDAFRAWLSTEHQSSPMVYAGTSQGGADVHEFAQAIATGNYDLAEAREQAALVRIESELRRLGKPLQNVVDAVLSRRRMGSIVQVDVQQPRQSSLISPGKFVPSPEPAATWRFAAVTIGVPAKESLERVDHNGVTSDTGLGDLIYFSFVSFTTTGYGDIRPESEVVRLATVAENILELVFTACLFAAAMRGAGGSGT
jgi:hypothetical protein